MQDFKPFPKIPRYNRLVTITEKIDGTNAVVAVEKCPDPKDVFALHFGPDGTAYNVYAGSRNRWITPDDDNFGFARWVQDHGVELIDLGEGIHHGEWWGQGIQRGYGLNEKRFSLFNTSRWKSRDTTEDVSSYLPKDPRADKIEPQLPPDCCHVVPVLAEGLMGKLSVAAGIIMLREAGSIAAPGFMRPEGVVLFHHASNYLFKATCENDESRKGQ